MVIRARVTELVVVADLKSAALNGRVGSNPTPGTRVPKVLDAFPATSVKRDLANLVTWL